MGWPGRDRDVSRVVRPATIRGGGSLLAAALAIGFAACTIERGDVRTPGGQPPEADTTRIRALLTRLAHAYAVGDTGTMRALIADDLTFFVDGAEGRGAGAALDSLSAARGRLGRRDLELASVEIELADGVTAWVVCRFSIGGDPEGALPARQARATLIMERREGDWTLVHAHLSRSPPRPTGNR